MHYGMHGYIQQKTVEQWHRLSTKELALRFGWDGYYTSLKTASNQLRAPQRILARAIAGYQAGILSAQAIATVQGKTQEEIEKELTSIGVVAQHMNWEECALVNLPDVAVDCDGV